MIHTLASVDPSTEEEEEKWGAISHDYHKVSVEAREDDFTLLGGKTSL